ncbi:MAG TPA: hypothetical protein VFQ08_08020 [Gaiella sp.]|nr:hypothetical protein [Gaiella sp.]
MGESPLDAEIDRLYGLPLAEFTKERDALARRLRADGKRDEATAIAGLRKPVLAAWVVNRLARACRTDVESLVEAAAAIRAGKPDAGERFRTIADGLARAARELLAAADRRPSDAVLRDVATTLRAAAAAEPDVLLRGRLTEPVEATGFEAMAGAAPRRPSSPAAGRQPKKKKKPQPDRARVQAARKALAEARDEARRLARAADAAEREASRLRADADAAGQGVADAAAALEKLASS